MKNYQFNDFTEKNFRKLVKLAKSKYQFVTYDQLEKADRFILWRHDIDFSVHRALSLAKIESEEEIVGTYFFRLSSNCYNSLEEEITKKAKAILKLGHHIGLHFDLSSYPIRSEEELIKYLRFEKKIFEELLDTELKVFSFHNPSSEILKNNKFKYADMINTYAEYFQSNVGYCSDSNGYWRNQRLQDMLEKSEEERLQVLTHPVWWQKTIMSPKERIWRSIDGRAARDKKLYQTRLKLFGRENVDGKYE